MKLSPEEKADGDYVRKSTIALLEIHIAHLRKLDEFEQKLIPLLLQLKTRISGQPLATGADLGRVGADYQYICKLVRGHVPEREFKAMGDKLADMGWQVPSELSPDREKIDMILKRGAIKSSSEFQMVDRYAKQLRGRGNATELEEVSAVLASYMMQKGT
ncbi:MAG TPA: hypothetical protein VK629_03125 [Steroidobacteraceae bacterium]|nr:hypothetical protein [Steroidobacteraceae bacterium]